MLGAAQYSCRRNQAGAQRELPLALPGKLRNADLWKAVSSQLDRRSRNTLFRALFTTSKMAFLHVLTRHFFRLTIVPLFPKPTAARCLLLPPRLGPAKGTSVKEDDGSMKVGIVGIGQLGVGLGAGLAELGNEVVCTDPDPVQVRLLERDEIPLPGVASVRSLERAAKRRLPRDDGGAEGRPEGAMHLPHAERGHGKRRLGRALAGGRRDRAVPGEQPGRGNYLPAPRGTNALVTKQLARCKGVTVHVASSPWQTRAPDRILENTGELAIGVRRREPSLVLQELYYSFLPGGQTCKVTEPENVELGAESPAIDAGQPQASSTADSSKSLAPSWAIRARASLTRQGRSSVDMGRRVLGIWRHRRRPLARSRPRNSDPATQHVVSRAVPVPIATLAFLQLRQ